MAIILKYTTSIDSLKTMMEITKCLVAHGAEKITTDYDEEGIPIALTFCLSINDSLVGFKLPANYEGVLRVMKNGKVSRKYANKEQAVRVSWRIIKTWVEAQMALVKAELAELPEVFLPYVVVPKTGNTLYGDFKENGMKLLN